MDTLNTTTTDETSLSHTQIEPALVTRVYHDPASKEYTQPLPDITDSGTLIDDDGDDMLLVGAQVSANALHHVLAATLRARNTRAGDQAAAWLEAHPSDDDFTHELEELLQQIEFLAEPRLVSIVVVSGDDYERIVDEANDLGGSTSAVVEILARWDTGDEIDQASRINGTQSQSQIERSVHEVIEHGGLRYWLLPNHDLRFYALYRRPLTDAR